MDASAGFPKTMTTLLPPGKAGVAEVTHFTLSEQDVRFANLHTMIHGRRDALVSLGRYVMLKVNGELVMSDTQMEKRTNREIVEEAHGRVLVARLGIGLVLHALAKKKNVTEITVVEKYPDVVTLVNPSLPLGMRVVVADIFKWRPKRGTRYDTIYFDIWSSICVDNLVEIRKLKRVFRPFLACGGWISAWKEDFR